MPLVMAAQEVRDTFRRSIRDRAGDVVRTLEFPAAMPVEVPWEDLPHIHKDLYHGVNPIEVCPKGKVKIIPKEDFDKILKENTELDQLDKATAPEVPGGENTRRRSNR